MVQKQAENPQLHPCSHQHEERHWKRDPGEHFEVRTVIEKSIVQAGQGCRSS